VGASGLARLTTDATSGRDRLGRPGGHATRPSTSPVSGSTQATRTCGGSPATEAATMGRPS
jgi:hypothetical protein